MAIMFKSGFRMRLKSVEQLRITQVLHVLDSTKIAHIALAVKQAGDQISGKRRSRGSAVNDLQLYILPL